ncbi:MAG: alpha/beta hydrolase, partial [Lewinella sp.]|nr:alpha/beta hydrolase [Lewinella sp.]
YGQWLHEILSRLRVKQGTLVAWSFGAFIALKSLPFAGDRVGQVILINPAGIVRGAAWRTWWQVRRPLRQFQRRRKQGALNRLQNALQTERQPANASCWPLFLLRYGLDLSPVPLLTAEQANRIRTPIRIIAASRDVLYPGRAVLRRARQLWPGWDDGLLLHGERHLLSRTGQAQVAAYVREVVEGRMG